MSTAQTTQETTQGSIGIRTTSIGVHSTAIISSAVNISKETIHSSLSDGLSTDVFTALPWNSSGLDLFDNENINFTWNESETHIDLFTDLSEYKIAQFINSYYLYLICLIGVPGNLACIVTLIFLNSKLSSSVYMLALAVADLIAIALKLSYFILTKHDIKLGDTNCQLIFMFGTVSQTYANWVLVAMTIERFVAICLPFQVKKLCTKRKTVSVLMILLVICIAINSHFLVTFEEINDPFMSWDCRPKEQYAEFIQFAWSWIDGTLYAILPLLLISVFNSLIIHAVRRSVRTKIRLTNRVSNSSELLSNQKQVTRMLLTTSLVFVVLVLPNCVFFIAREYWSWKESSEGIAKYYLLYQIVFLLSDLNHAVNFYLYFLSGRKFRRKFIQILCCNKNSIRQSIHANVARSLSNVATIISQTASPARFVSQNPFNDPERILNSNTSSPAKMGAQRNSL